MPRVASALVLAAVLLATPSPAAADSLDTTVVSSGTLTISWRGDPARGCAEQGVCDVRGAVTLGTSGRQSGSSTYGRRPPGLVPISIPAGPAVVRVLRGPLTDPAGACVELIGHADLALAPVGRRRGRVRLELQLGERGFGEGSNLPAGRCTGPLPEDLGTALPTVFVPPRLLRRGRSVYDLRGRSTFAAGPFTAEVVSSLRLRVTRRVRRDEDGADRGHDVDGGRSRGRRGRIRTLALTYRLAPLDGTLVTEWTGGPGCAGSPACGVRGRHELRPGTAASRLTILAAGRGRAIRRRTVASGLAALAAGRLEVFGFVETGDARSGRGAAEVTWPEGPPCRSQTEGAPPPLEVASDDGVVRFALGDALFEAPGDPLRTRCEGPAGEDVVGDGALAIGDVPAAALAQPALEVRLRPGAAPAGGPFALTRSGEVVARLQRVRARVTEDRR